jgi:hypothetical protein
LASEQKRLGFDKALHGETRGAKHQGHGPAVERVVVDDKYGGPVIERRRRYLGRGGYAWSQSYRYVAIGSIVYRGGHAAARLGERYMSNCLFII